MLRIAQVQRLVRPDGVTTAEEEVPLNWNKLIRQAHRWLSIAFTLVVIVNGIAVAEKKYSTRLGLLAVFVLALQFFTGMYLFVLPYVAKRLSRSHTETAS